LLIVAAALALWRREVISLPPYEDQAVGLWNEADFLVEHDFDYYRLRYEEPSYMSARPGARSYVISVLPTMVALLMKSAPSIPTAIVMAHGFNFLATSLILLTMFAVLRPSAGVVGSLLVCLAMLTTPLFSTQVDMVGMDIPLAVFTTLAAVAVWRERFVLAAIMSTVAFFMKATGGLLTLATITYLAVLLAFGGRRGRAEVRRRWWIGLAANVAVLGLQTLVVWVGDPSARMRAAIDWPAILRLPYAVFWCPDVVALLAVCLVLSLVAARRWFRRERRQPSPGGSLHVRLVEAIRTRPVVFFCWIVISGMLAANWLYIFIPRYFTAAMPLVYLMFGMLLFVHFRRPRLAGMALCALIALNLANSDGRFFPDMSRVGAKTFAKYVWIHPRQCALSERSRAYLNDQRANLEAIRRLEQVCGSDPIFVATPQLFYLTKPRLGYVTRALNVYDVVNYEVAVPNFRDAMMLHSGNHRPRPIFLWTGKSRVTVPPPEKGDEIIYRDTMPPPLVVYRKTVDAAMSKSPRNLEQWYLDKTWPGPWLADRLEARAVYLARSGRVGQALSESFQALDFMPDDPTLQKVGGLVFDLWQEQKRRQRAEQRGGEPPDELDPRFPTLVKLDRDLTIALKTLESGKQFDGEKERTGPPSSHETAYTSAIEALTAGDRQTAASRFAAVLANGSPSPRQALAQFALGLLSSTQGRCDDAKAHYMAALEQIPELPEAYHQLGLIDLQEQHYADSLELFSKAVKLAPLFADAHNSLGMALAKTGDIDAAEDRFIEAIWIAPGHVSAKQNLKRLLRMRWAGHGTTRSVGSGDSTPKTACLNMQGKAGTSCSDHRGRTVHRPPSREGA